MLLQQDDLDRQTAWQDEQVTNAKAESQRLTEEKNILMDQLAASQKAYIDLNTERECFLHHLMADSRWMCSVMKDLPKGGAGLCEDQDLRIFRGSQAGKLSI